MYKKMLRTVLNKGKKLYPQNRCYTNILPPTSQTVQISQTKHSGNSWKKKKKTGLNSLLITKVFLKSTTHGHTSVGRLISLYIDQSSENIDAMLKTLM